MIERFRTGKAGNHGPERNPNATVSGSEARPVAVRAKENHVFMGIGASLFLIVVGAILAFAVTAEVSGIDITTVGWILMIAGGIGLLLSLVFWSTWGGVGTWRRETVVRRDPYDRTPPPY
jgi:hypothetical protein